MRAKKNIQLEQVAAGFERGIGALDELRVMHLGDGLRLQFAQNQTHTRELKRLERKYGKDHSRTLNAAAKIELRKEHMQVMSIVRATASAPRPDPGNGWAVDGFVRTAKGDPVDGVTVAAYDRRKRWYEELGYGCTNEEGYFSIVVEKLSKKPPSPVYMLASKGKKLLESNEVQLAPEPKSSDRVEIIIDDTGGKGDCMTPPGGKDKPRPPEQPVGEKEKPSPVAPEKEERKKALEEEQQKLKKSKEQEKGQPKRLRLKVPKLTSINGIGPQRMKKLEQADIKDVKTFVDTDNRKLAEILGDLDFNTMKKDAKALSKKK